MRGVQQLLLEACTAADSSLQPTGAFIQVCFRAPDKHQLLSANKLSVRCEHQLCHLV